RRLRRIAQHSAASRLSRHRQARRPAHRRARAELHRHLAELPVATRSTAPGARRQRHGSPCRTPLPVRHRTRPRGHQGEAVNAPSFNLVDEPWIRVRLLDGTSDTASLREVFHRSTESSRIAGELATQDFAILRLVLAVFYRSVPDDDELAEIWESGTLPLDDLDAYLDQWHARFDAFDG